MRRLRRLAATLPLLLLPLLASQDAPAQGAAGVKMVVHESNPIEAITRAQASLFFLKKVTQWEDGRDVLPVDQADDSAVRAQFSEQIHTRTVAEVKAYWQRMIFSGRAIPPPAKGSDREVIDFVRSNPGAIGYVSLRAGTPGVKVVEIRE